MLHGRLLSLRAAAILAGISTAVAALAGCGGSHRAATASSPTTTAPVTTAPKRILNLVAANFPSHLEGTVAYSVDRTHANPQHPGGFRLNYTITLSQVSLRLARVSGDGAKRTASYDLIGARGSFTGSEVLTTSKCETTRIVWHGSKQPIRGVLAVFGARFDSSVGFTFLVPQRGASTTQPCGSTVGGRRNIVTRVAGISGNASLRLTPVTAPEQRFTVGIEVQSVAAGAEDRGGYTINGIFAPPARGVPVKLCTLQGAKLACPSA